jgi:hypothetical protein
MPKEVIRNASVLGDDQLCHTEIRWSRDRYVQIATVKKADDYHKDGRVEGWFVDMDRDTLNEAIRVLRRARDQAFGADA